MATAIAIGGGINIGGGISVGAGGGGGGGVNIGSITVASRPLTAGGGPGSTGTEYGASDGTYLYGGNQSPLGTVTGGTVSLLSTLNGSGFFGPFVDFQLRLIDGSYSGFTVVDGAINGDFVTSQSFTVGGVTATLGSYGTAPNYYYFSGDPFNLENKVGQTLSVAYNL